MKLIPFSPSSTPRVKLVTVEQCWIVSEVQAIHGPYEASSFLAPYFAGKDREHFVALHLDAANQPLSVEVVSVGTLSASLVHPREVFKGAILANAHAIIAAHNHPTGRVEPSLADRAAYQKLKDAGELLDIKLLDFLVIGDGNYHSFSESSGVIVCR